MQLREFLNNEGAGKINVIAINWTETDYGASPARLKRFMGLMPPAIRVVAGTSRTERDFGGLGHVPVSFVFAAQGKLISGTGDTSPLGRDDLRKLIGYSG